MTLDPLGQNLGISVLKVPQVIPVAAALGMGAEARVQGLARSLPWTRWTGRARKEMSFEH